MKVVFTRVSVLQKRRNIFYSFAFKTLNKTECIIKECKSNLFKREHAVRYIKTTFIFEHQVAVIVLQQTKCLKCNKSWKILSDLVHYETTVHNKVYTSRMNIFRLLIELSFCTRLVLLICNYICLLVTDFVNENSFKQSSYFQTHNVISSLTFLSSLSVSFVVSVSKNSTLSSVFEIHHLSQTSVYCS